VEPIESWLQNWLIRGAKRPAPWAGLQEPRSAWRRFSRHKSAPLDQGIRQ
jgi:hypothetical protein